jgi:hypothetical protein
MEKLEQNFTPANEAPETINTPETNFEDKFAEFENLRDLQDFLIETAKATDGVIELSENGYTTQNRVDDTLSFITGVKEGRPGYVLTAIPGMKLREAVKQLLEKEKTAKTPETNFEDKFSEFDNLSDLRDYLTEVAQSTNGVIELSEADDRKRKGQVGDIFSSISGVKERRPGYTMEGIPGIKLREAVGRILEKGV